MRIVLPLMFSALAILVIAGVLSVPVLPIVLMIGSAGIGVGFARLFE